MNPNSWTTPDLVCYLQQIGLGQYAETFIKNGIDGSTLLQLNEQKLKELGIQSIGHRIKLTRFINSNKINNKAESPSETILKAKLQTDQKVDNDSIHPLNKSIHFQIYLKQTEEEMKKDDSLSFKMTECRICHQKIPFTFYDHHEKSCRNIFLQCQREYQRRGINLTDKDIIDLMNGKVPIHHIKLIKCNYCGRKFAPSTFSKHETFCKKKMESLKLNSDVSTSSSTSPKTVPNDYRKKHQQLIEFIKLQRKEMNQILLSETCFPIVKTEATEAF